MDRTSDELGIRRIFKTQAPLASQEPARSEGQRTAKGAKPIWQRSLAAYIGRKDDAVERGLPSPCGISDVLACRRPRELTHIGFAFPQETFVSPDRQISPSLSPTKIRRMRGQARKAFQKEMRARTRVPFFPTAPACSTGPADARRGSRFLH